MFNEHSGRIETISERELLQKIAKTKADTRSEFFKDVRLRISLGKKHTGASYTASRAAHGQGAPNDVLDGCEKQ